ESFGQHLLVLAGPPPARGTTQTHETQLAPCREALGKDLRRKGLRGDAALDRRGGDALRQVVVDLNRELCGHRDSVGTAPVNAIGGNAERRRYRSRRRVEPTSGSATYCLPVV